MSSKDDGGVYPFFDCLFRSRHLETAFALAGICRPFWDVDVGFGISTLSRTLKILALCSVLSRLFVLTLA